MTAQQKREAALTASSSAMQALEELVINANRLCDRNLGGTYEEDCRRSIDKGWLLLAILLLVGLCPSCRKVEQKLAMSRAVPTKTVLTGANLTFKCAFYPPYPTNATEQGRPLAGRVETLPGGAKEFHLISGYHLLAEYTPPPCLQGQFPEVRTFTDIGSPYGVYNGFAWKPVYSNVGDLTFAGVYVDQRTTPETVYTVSSSYYNTNSSESEVNLVVATRNANGTMTPKGMYRTSPVTEFGTRCGSGLTAIPDDFSMAVFGERRLALGFGGGLWTGIVSNKVSVGPCLFAFRPQDGSLPDHSYISGPYTPLLWHPWNTNAYTVPRIARVPKNQPTLNRYGFGPELQPEDAWVPQLDGTAYWSISDSSAAGAWLDYPDLGLHGLVIIATHFEGDALGIIRSAAVSPTDPRVWNITITPVDGHGPFKVGMTGIHVPTSDPSAHYGGYEGVVSAVNANVISVMNIGNGYQPTATPPTIGGYLVAGAWYGDGGWKNPQARTWLTVYDPATLAASAASSGPWSEIDPANASELNLGLKRTSWPTPGTIPVNATAIVANPLNHDIYVMVDNADRGSNDNENRKMVYVYEVTASGSPPPTDPLVITCPTVPAVTSTTGAPMPVSFSITTTGGIPPIVTTSMPTSGSSFAVGTTTVNARAVDSVSANVSCMFPVTVIAPAPPDDPCKVTPLSVKNVVFPTGQTGTKSGSWNSSSFALTDAGFKWNPLRFEARDSRGCTFMVSKP